MGGKTISYPFSWKNIQTPGVVTVVVRTNALHLGSSIITLFLLEGQDESNPVHKPQIANKTHYAQTRRPEKNRREKAPDGKMALGLSLPLRSLKHKDAEASGSRNIFTRLAAKQFATLIGKFTKSRAIRLYGPSCRRLN